MSVIVVLIGFSLVVALGFLAAFLWAVRSGQYDDDVSPSIRILYDNEDDKSKQPNTNPNHV
ncbi:MAG: cbb3-type cytochrome oxidase assembly protein CcoS [Bacteroidota bacterium]